jgi:tellurite resistance protein
MVSTIRSPYTSEQVSVWLRGLVTIAWADGHFDIEEQNLIANLTHQELSTLEQSKPLEKISPAELAAVLGHDPVAAENFLRMAVMVALADGAYSFCEDETIYQFSHALGFDSGILKVLRSTLQDSTPSTKLVTASEISPDPAYQDVVELQSLLDPVREWLDKMEVHDPKLAHFLCKMIPSQCPFERDINLFGRKVAHIPPLCKLNPLYEQLVGLRFRAMSYLADDCGEDISPYC